MKILKESKSKISEEVIANYISDGWSQVSYLKNIIKVVKEEFTGVAILEEYFQDVLDAYLIGLGRLEAAAAEHKLLQPAKEPVEEEKPAKTSKASKAKLSEDIIIDNPVVNIDNIQVTKDDLEDIEPFVDENGNTFDSIFDEEPNLVVDPIKQEQPEGRSNNFEIMDDFPEPIEGLTDEDISL